MISTFTGISFLSGTVKNDGGVILKSESVDEMIPVTVGLRCVLLMGELAFQSDGGARHDRAFGVCNDADNLTSGSLGLLGRRKSGKGCCERIDAWAQASRPITSVPLSTHVENAWSSLPAEPKSVTAYLPKLR
jgi:hypothetical protein